MLIILLVGISISPLLDFIQKGYTAMDNELSSRVSSVSGTLEPLGWWNPDWMYSEKITINRYKVADDLANFPVLFSVASDDLKNAQPDGNDFVFTSQDNTTKYNHEVELYDHLTGELIAWVNLPSISADEDTIFYIYYGNTDCENQENVAGTWDSNYVGVFHMNQASGSMIDSAGTQDATNYENDTQYQQNGKVGYCVELGGYRDGGYFLVEDNNDAYKFHNGDVTLEAWVKLDQNKTSDDTILFLGRSTTDYFPWPQMTLRKLKNTEENGKFMTQCGETDESKTRALSNDNGDEVIGKWVHASGVVDYSGDEIMLFMDGIKQTITDTVGDYDLSALPDYRFKVAIGYDGMGEDPNYNYLDGKIDEVRISNITRSPAWISTSYNNMFDPESFMVFGEGYTITTTCIGNGNISKDPDQTTYFPESVVQLTATEGKGWSFDRWSGDVLPGKEHDNPITISMDDNKDVTAYFNDIAKPNITDVEANPIIASLGEDINISCNVQDNFALDSVKVDITYPDETTMNISMNNLVSSHHYYYTTDYSQLGDYRYHIWACDTYGNANITTIYNFEIIQTNIQPNQPSNEYPTNNSDYESVYATYLNVTVSDPDGDNLNVTFYWGNGTLIGMEGDVSNNSIASIYLSDFIDPDWLSHDIDYSWYVTIEDNYDEIISPTWTFHTSMAWDVNEDKIINYLDMSAISSRYGDQVDPGSIGSDINGDGEINYLDVSSLSTNYGESY